MKLLAEEKEIVDKPDAEELKNAAGELELDHVSTVPRQPSLERIRLNFLQ